MENAFPNNQRQAQARRRDKINPNEGHLAQKMVDGGKVLNEEGKGLRGGILAW